MAWGAETSVAYPVSREIAVIFYTPYLKELIRSAGLKLHVWLSRIVPLSYI